MTIPRLAVLLASGWLYSCTSSRPAADANTATETRKPLTEIQLDDSVRRNLKVSVVAAEELPSGTPVTATGQLQINEDASWIVGAMTDGKVTSVPVRVGDEIRHGQVLAILHSHDVHDARATLRHATSEFAKQKVLEKQALAVRDRTRRLFNLRAASREQLEAAEAMYLSATNSVSAAQADVDKARFHLTDYLEVPAEPNVGSDHESSRDALTIKSPASGTLMERKATAGTVVSAGDPVFTIADLTSLWLIAAVNEADMSRVRAGQRVSITVRAFADRKFSGKVLRLGERLDPQTRTLQVRVLLPNADGLLKPDMFATAEFQTDEIRTVLQVPEAAVQDVNGRQVVFLSKGGGSFYPREITAGARNGGRIEVLSGLRPGDSVVVNGAYLLKTQLMKESGD